MRNLNRYLITDETIEYLPRFIIDILVNKLNPINTKEATFFYSQFLEKGDLCFDVGANVGNRTSIFRNIGCKVVSFEPQSLPYKILEKLCGDDKNIQIINKGIGNKEGSVLLNICKEASTLSSVCDDWENCGLFPGYSWKNSEKIEIITLDKAIDLFSLPKFCKIDVEGFEPRVFSGLNQQIPIISFEFVKNNPSKTRSCLDKLQELGYKKYNISWLESFKFVFDTWVDLETLVFQINSRTIPFGDIYCSEG